MSTSWLLSVSNSDESATPLSSRKSDATRKPGWRVQLWNFLFPGEDAAGVEGAAKHYGHGQVVGVRSPDFYAEDVRRGVAASSGPSCPNAADAATSSTSRAADDSMEPWHYMQVPLSSVILFLRLRQRLAHQWMQGWMYGPFFVMLTVFVLVGSGCSSSQIIVDFDATRRASLAQSHASSQVRETTLREAFRLDTETAISPSATSHVGDFVSGNSARYPWMYSWYNETVNIWTAPPDRQSAVDAQVERVASTHHEPTFLSLTSIRTRRDVLRWLQLQVAPRLWNCKNPSFERSWRSTVTGITISSVRCAWSVDAICRAPPLLETM